MSYIKDMLEEERKNKEKLEEILNNRNVQKIVLRAGQLVDKETILDLRGTKALVLEDMSNTDEEYDNRESWGELLLSAHDRPMTGINVATWSSLVRHAIEILRPQIEYAKTIVNADEFIVTFQDCVEDICDETKLNLNSNCPKRLYKYAEEPDLIKSSVYMNNKNHFIPILKDEQGVVWGLCAVYTGEIIVMLEALLKTISVLVKTYKSTEEYKQFPQHTIVIAYINRKYLDNEQSNMTQDEKEEINNDIDDIDDLIQKLQLAKELIRIQGKLSSVSEMIMHIYGDITDIQKKYKLPTIDELLKLE